MVVRLKTGSYWHTVGSEDLLFSFFSTIAYHLEDNLWGSKYPSVMRELYHGKLYSIEHALYELDDIKDKLEEYSMDQIVWDINNMSRRPPWEENIVESKATLSKSFISINGEDLFVVFQDVLTKARETGTAVKIITY